MERETKPLQTLIGHNTDNNSEESGIFTQTSQDSRQHSTHPARLDKVSSETRLDHTRPDHASSSPDSTQHLTHQPRPDHLASQTNDETGIDGCTSKNDLVPDPVSEGVVFKQEVSFSDDQLAHDINEAGFKKNMGLSAIRKLVWDEQNCIVDNIRVSEVPDSLVLSDSESNDKHPVDSTVESLRYEVINKPHLENMEIQHKCEISSENFENSDTGEHPNSEHTKFNEDKSDFTNSFSSGQSNRKKGKSSENSRVITGGVKGKLFKKGLYKSKLSPRQNDFRDMLKRAKEEVKAKRSSSLNSEKNISVFKRVNNNSSNNIVDSCDILSANSETNNHTCVSSKTAEFKERKSLQLTHKSESISLRDNANKNLQTNHQTSNLSSDSLQDDFGSNFGDVSTTEQSSDGFSETGKDPQNKPAAYGDGCNGWSENCVNTESNVLVINGNQKGYNKQNVLCDNTLNNNISHSPVPNTNSACLSVKNSPLKSNNEKHLGNNEKYLTNCNGYVHNSESIEILSSKTNKGNKILKNCNSERSLDVISIGRDLNKATLFSSTRYDDDKAKQMDDRDDIAKRQVHENTTDDDIESNTESDSERIDTLSGDTLDADYGPNELESIVESSMIETEESELLSRDFSHDSDDSGPELEVFSYNGLLQDDVIEECDETFENDTNNDDNDDDADADDINGSMQIKGLSTQEFLDISKVINDTSENGPSSNVKSTPGNTEVVNGNFSDIGGSGSSSLGGGLKRSVDLETSLALSVNNQVLCILYFNIDVFNHFTVVIKLIMA